MSLIGLLLWTLPFTTIFGFSFTVAKLSVVVLHFIECLTVLRILQLCGVGANLALVGILALILNPLHFVHVTSRDDKRLTRDPTNRANPTSHHNA